MHTKTSMYGCAKQSLTALRSTTNIVLHVFASTFTHVYDIARSIRGACSLPPPQSFPNNAPSAAPHAPPTLSKQRTALIPAEEIRSAREPNRVRGVGSANPEVEGKVHLQRDRACTCWRALVLHYEYDSDQR